MWASIPALAAYAATDAPALPEESSATASTPSSAATDIIVAVPLSLNEPVGFRYSSLAFKSRNPSVLPVASRGTIGVFPSPREIGGDSAWNGIGGTTRLWLASGVDS